MNRQQALETLGIYEGTSKQRIDEKFEILFKDASDQQMILLREAREILFADAPTATIEVSPHVNPSDANRKRGPLIIVALVLGTLFCFSFAIGGVYFFDAKTNPKKANSMLVEAEQLAIDYNSFIKDSGVKPSEMGVDASALLEEGKKLKADKDYAAAIEKLLAARNTYVKAFDEEARITNIIWNQQVVAAFNEKLRGKFPFDPQSEVEAEISVVQEIFNPVDGYLHTASMRINNLKIVNIDDKPIFHAPDTYQQSIGAGMRISEALFCTGEKEITITFDAELLPHVRRGGLSLSFQSQNVRSSATKATPCVVKLDGKEKTIELALISLFERRGDNPKKTPTLKFSSKWGLGGALPKFAKIIEAEGRKAVWELDPSKLNNGREKPQSRKNYPMLHLITSTDANAFNPEIYKEFRP
ncbi:MAG: hypothetical protein L3J82_06900 [Planctomycetes bacterium]|nr:hypothetical protein [Planctomycetota bacterium]